MRPFRIGLIACFLIVLWFLPLGVRDLIHSDEGRHAEIAREMWASGNWMTPRLNGIPYFENPPLHYWATALFYGLLSPAEWTARLWPALTGCAGIVLSWWFGRRFISSTVAGFAALIQCSTLGYVGLAHFNLLDMGVCFFLQLTLFGYLVRVQSAKDEQLAGRMMAAGIAGAVLSKGIIGVIVPAMVFMADSVWHRDKQFWKKSLQIRIWGSALMLVAPWLIAIHMLHPEYSTFFFHSIYSLPASMPAQAAKEPWYYLISLLLAGLLPWTLIWVKSLKDWKKNLQVLLPKEKFSRVQRVLILWSLLIFVFFSYARVKLPFSLLPVLPALAWLLAFSLHKQPLRVWRIPLMVSFILCIASMVSLPWVSMNIADPWLRQLFEAYRNYLLISFIMLALGFAWLLWQENREKTAQNLFKITIWIPAVVIWSSAIQIAIQGFQVFSPYYSVRLLVDEIVKVQGAFRQNIPFYSVKMDEHTLPFYLRRTITLVQPLPEKIPGCKQAAAACIDNAEQWRIRWLNEPGNAYAIMPVLQYEQLRQTQIPMRVVGQNPRYVVVTRF